MTVLKYQVVDLLGGLMNRVGDYTELHLSLTTVSWEMLLPVSLKMIL